MNNLLIYHSQYNPQHIKLYTNLTPKNPFKNTIEWLYDQLTTQLNSIGMKKNTILYDLATDDISIIVRGETMTYETAESLYQSLLLNAGLRLLSVNVHDTQLSPKKSSLRTSEADVGGATSTSDVVNTGDVVHVATDIVSTGDVVNVVNTAKQEPWIYLHVENAIFPNAIKRKSRGYPLYCCGNEC